jgi:hypothetical protein
MQLINHTTGDVCNMKYVPYRYDPVKMPTHFVA